MAATNLASPVGLPVDRVDGRLKGTGKAEYAYEYAAQGSALYGVIVTASVGKGRVAAADVQDAQKAPGVRLVLTKDNAPPQHPFGPVDLPDRFARAMPALNNDDVPYFGFPVAFVVADTFEQATAAAAMVRVGYAPARGSYDLRVSGSTAINPGRISSTDPADSAIGDFDTAFASAPVKIDAAYTTPYQHQAPMEPHATMAVWDGSKLTVHTSAQLTASPQEGLARTFNIRKEDVRIITRYIGGGFGGKLPYYFEATLAAMGARILGRPVKVAMTRPQLFYMTTHRTASEQRLRLGADSNGRLTAYGQDALVQTASFDQYVEPVMLAARTLYAAGSHGIASPSSTCRVRIRCARRATRSVLCRSNAPWTNSRNGLTSIQWNCGCATTRRTIPSTIGPSPHAISPNAYVKAPYALAGTSVLPSRRASAMAAG
jgi:xanthine dehydrogenase YagR molybdenum-binding subunit